jgi:hypothetical protein
VHVEDVPFAREGSRLTADLEDLVTWLVSKQTGPRSVAWSRVDWQTIGRIIERDGQEKLDPMANPSSTSVAGSHTPFACQFIALPGCCLIERKLRAAMTRDQITNLPLYPEDRSCTAPTAARVFEHLHHSNATTSSATAKRSKHASPNSHRCKPNYWNSSTSSPTPRAPEHEQPSPLHDGDGYGPREARKGS